MSTLPEKTVNLNTALIKSPMRCVSVVMLPRTCPVFMLSKYFVSYSNKLFMRFVLRSLMILNLNFSIRMLEKYTKIFLLNSNINIKIKIKEISFV
ncbi:unnamed protein product [marine sediment metagenome]|uniref:Uncharacterized protein n=1 Tax=marine sediment metagenome TaxID=412755 RepID=X1BT28_9ZZZZ